MPKLLTPSRGEKLEVLLETLMADKWIEAQGERRQEKKKQIEKARSSAGWQSDLGPLSAAVCRPPWLSVWVISVGDGDEHPWITM